MAIDPQRWTLRTQEAVNDAVAMAKAAVNPEVTPDHLLAALLGQAEGVVLPMLQRVGKAPADVVLSVNCWLVRVTPDAAATREFLDRMAGQFDVAPAELDASPAVLVGTVDAICTKLEASRREYGFSHVQLDAGFHPRSLDAIAPVVANLAG